MALIDRVETAIAAIERRCSEIRNRMAAGVEESLYTKLVGEHRGLQQALELLRESLKGEEEDG